MSTLAVSAPAKLPLRGFGRLVSLLETVIEIFAEAQHQAALGAAELNVAPKTVYSHRRNISSKLGIRCGRELLRYAIHWARRTHYVDRRWISPP